MNDKGVRIYDLARRLAVPSRELMTFLKKKGIETKSHMSTIDGEAADMILEAFGAKRARSQRTGTPKSRPKPTGRTFVPPQRETSRAQQPSGQQAQQPSSSQASRSQPATRPQQSQAKTPHAQAARPQQSSGKPAPSRSAQPSRTPSPTRQHPSSPSGKKPWPRKSAKSGGEERPRIPEKRGRTFEPPETEGTLIEKTPRRGVGKKHEFSRKDATPEAGRGTGKKRNFTRKAADQDRPPSKKRQDVQDDGVPKRKPGKAVGRRYEKAAEEYRRHPEKEQAAVSPDQKPISQRRPARRPKKAPQKKEVGAQKPAAPAPVEETPKRVRIPEVIMLKDLADQMALPPAQIIRHLMEKGILANVNQMLEPEAAKSIAEHFGFEIDEQTIDNLALEQEEVVDDSKLQARPPVVTIMGHVDHGKTTLLDAIRESKIVDSEFGGITQHIGAYVVDVNDQQVVFLDTPGHEAFTAMRARGAQVTDEVILVVAADDGIMPQTIEAIDHAKAAKVPIVVAINKIDLPGANPDRVMQELTKHGLTPEDWGGETICVQVSAKQHTNLDELLEMIVLQAEMLELKANPDALAKGVVVEAMLDKGRGPVATVLVRSGTLRVGNAFVAGIYHGRVRAMFDDRGRNIKEAGPSMPVEVLGLTGVPEAGDGFAVVENDRTARQIAERRQEQQQKSEFLKTGKITLEELHQHIKEGEVQELRIIIKADVHGSVEALSDALARLSTEQVRLQVIHGGVGAINETDVMLAAAESNAIVLGFNVRPVAKAREMAEKEQIDIRLYTIIYQAIEDIKKAMEGLLAPTYKEVLEGQANVQAVFSVPKVGNVAGCRVVQGKISRNSIVKLYRDHREIYEGKIASLRRVKDDVREVTVGYECGINLENYNDIKEGDIIEAYTLEKVIMTLEEAAKKR